MQGVVDQILEFFAETVEVVLSLEILHLQSLIVLGVQAVHDQGFQNVTL